MEKQVAYSGLLEVAKVRQAGFANRRDLVAFWGYYKVCLEPERVQQLLGESAAARAAALMSELGIGAAEYLIGVQLIFFTVRCAPSHLLQWPHAHDCVVA
jgi:myosin heavy subunit